MLNATHDSFRRLAGFGITATLAAAGLAFAVPGSAEEPKKETVIEKKIIMHGDGKAEWHGKDGAHHEMKCPGQMTVVESSGGTDQKKEERKIAICSKSGDKAEIAAGLEKALARVEQDTDIDPAARADLSAKLRAKIAELRGN